MNQEIVEFKGAHLMLCNIIKVKFKEGWILHSFAIDPTERCSFVIFQKEEDAPRKAFKK